MAREGLTGTRIRERRVMVGAKQSNLARQIGISASYLNLIEHNRRRIGGKLLLDIAAALGVEASALTEGAEAALIATLREAAAGARMPETEIERAEEFAGRFPGWADTLATAHRKIAALERTIETLSDRLAHDPALAASVHEVLSTAASIRSAASILAEDKDLAPEWQERFHTNIDEDSRRLAESSKALVGFLDAETGDAAGSSSPQEEVEAFLEARNYGFAEIEDGRAQVDDLVAQDPALTSVAARHIARGVLERVRADSARVAMADLEQALAQGPLDPLALARAFDVSVPCILRRLAAAPTLTCGLVVADRSGSLLFRKAVQGFTIPRYGPACPLWPLFEALSVPGQMLHQRVSMSGASDVQFDCFAAAEFTGPATLNAPPLAQATMLVLPVSTGAARAEVAVKNVGAACRICPVRACAGRREPSILSDGF